MTQLILKPNSEQMIEQLIDQYDGIMVGINSLSVNVPITFSLVQLDKIIDFLTKKDKKIFVTLNKNMHEKDLNLLEKTLQFLDKKKVTGVCFYDIALVNLNQKNHYHFPLVWAQEHFTTNYATCNYWRKYGASMIQLSSDITMREILEIRAHTENELIVPIFGHLSMFVSRRHLVENYLNEFHIPKKETIYYMNKEGKSYPIVDDEIKTEVYSADILLGLQEYLILNEHNVDYVTLDSFEITDENMAFVLKTFHEVNDQNVKELEENLKQTIPNLSTLFFHQETIYKVK